LVFSNFVLYIWLSEFKIAFMTTTAKSKVRNQVKLSDEEVEYLKKEMAKYPTKVAAGIEMKINPDTLDRATRIKSCSEASYRILFPDKEIPT
jgi:histidinol phosphatase-like PHP family hydrolase